MLRYGWYAPTQQQYGWETTSDEYRAHLAKIERMNSSLPDVPHFPSVHKAFNNKYPYGEEKESTTEPELQQQHQKKSTEKAQNKVQENERIEMVESAPQINDNSCYEAREGNVDVKADGFIQRKRRGFELCKWQTFKVL